MGKLPTSQLESTGSTLKPAISNPSQVTINTLYTNLPTVLEIQPFNKMQQEWSFFHRSL